MVVRLAALAIVIFYTVSCAWLGTRELLIAVKPEWVPQLTSTADPTATITPTATGLPSLDTLNEEWGVVQMTALYPNLSPDDETAVHLGLAGVFKLTVPRGTNVEAMIAAYEADPVIEYAEPNAPVTIE
jgi:hypothetical protein